VIVDLGCGDGRSVLAAAAAEPRSLVLGVDAVAAPMAESSRRAARTARKGGLPNAMFLEASAEAFARALPGTAERLVLLFPWGSLLRGALGLDPAVADAIGGITAPGGRVRIVTSVTPRDGVADVPRLDEAAVAAVGRRLAGHGLRLVAGCLLSPSEVRVLASTWARRIAAGREAERPVWSLELVRGGEGTSRDR
jgi:16S rRNA (adenine(1408)-N(1))-methyltransferase